MSIAERILADATDRRGWRHEWDTFDDDVKAEIKATWAAIEADEIQALRDRVAEMEASLEDIASEASFYVNNDKASELARDIRATFLAAKETP